MSLSKKYQLPVVAGCSMLATALLVTSFNAQAEFSVSGHVAYNLVDRDSEEDLVFQRNGFSESRFRIIADKELESGLKVGLVQEFGIAEGEGALDSRRQEVLFTGDFGGIRFGQGNDAGDGLLNGDLSGTSVIQPVASLSAAYGYSSSNYNGFDPGRGERIRYDSPKLGGSTVVSAQLGENSEKEIGVSYKKKFEGGSQIRAGLFISDSGDADKDSNGILISYKMNNGLNFTVASSSMDNSAGAGNDGDFTSFKIGYTTGKHAVSLISGTSENAKNAVETDATGVAYVYKLDKAIEVYGSVQQFDSDDDTADEDFTVIGTRVKF